MKYSLLPLCASFALLSACSSHTDIADLQMPETVTITGQVTEFDGESFVLRDDSGAIPVEWEGDDMVIYGLANGSTVILTGYLDAEGEFEAHTLTRPPVE